VLNIQLVKRQISGFEEVHIGENQIVALGGKQWPQSPANVSTRAGQ
jgi:hypothetical protein